MRRIDFNAGWTVTNEEGKTRHVNLPDDAMIYEKRSKDSKTGGSGGYFMPGKYTYKKSFKLPENHIGKRIVLECEGVYQNSHVILNGEEIYFRPYGYTNYFVDLSDRLKNDRDNDITIIADNSFAPNSRWYSGSGIYREVALWVGEKESIAPEGIKICTLSRDLVEIKTELLGTSEGIITEILILDEDKVVASGSGPDCQIRIPDAVNWSEKNPKLYQCKVNLIKDGKVIDSASEKFGVRTVFWNGRGLFINDENVLLRGACIHHDNGILGACCFADAEYRRVRQLKEAGFNAIRSAHNPLSKAMLRACDELGMYVMDETFDMWFIKKNVGDYGGDTFSKWWRIDVKQMIDKDYSHPSVIMYSIGNEISDFGSAQGQEMCQEMSSYIRRLDPSRAITSGCNIMLAALVAKGKGMYGEGKDKSNDTMDSAPTSEFFNAIMSRMGVLMEFATKGKDADKIVEKTSCYLDIPGYNYAGMRYRKEAKLYPDRPFVGSETLCQRLFYNWGLVKKIPQLVGDFMWTGYDYLGEAGIGSVRYVDKKTKKPAEPGLVVLGGPGVIDITGMSHPEVQWNKLIWDLDDAPEIAVEPMNMADYQTGIPGWRTTDGVASWSWERCQNAANKVTVYAKGAKAELYVNGKKIGTRAIKENKAIFKKVTYIPGEIKTVILDDNGKEIASKKLKSATGATSVAASADKTSLRANGQDLCFVDINLVGENAVLRSNDDAKVTVTINGPAILQGFGSARPCFTENYYSATHTTYRGHALAVIRAGYEPGEVTVTVSAKGLNEQKITMTILPDEEREK